MSKISKYTDMAIVKKACVEPLSVVFGVLGSDFVMLAKLEIGVLILGHFTAALPSSLIIHDLSNRILSFCEGLRRVPCLRAA